ncbi:MAG: GNAT family N-acetyltransferase [Flavisolibacter sp.]
MSQNKIIVRISNASDLQYVSIIENQIAESTKDLGVKMLRRSPELISEKIILGEAVIACATSGEWVGFSYIQPWDNATFVANCALIVAPPFRQHGIARRIKEKILDLCQRKYPGAKIFGLTASLAVMKVNSGLGFRPVTYSEITQNEQYWKACRSCPNYSILQSRKQKNCLCTAMVYSY